MTGIWNRLERQPPDALLAIIGMFAADPRPGKIDLGAGVYKDEAGRTPVFAAVKAAEEQLLAEQQTKAYVGPVGNKGFFRALVPLVFGADAAVERIGGFQTTGGTGALRLAAELIARANPGARIHVGEPTWANHPPIIDAARLTLARHPHYDPVAQALCMDDILAALTNATPGDAVLLHGCCHNPTGIDLAPDDWEAVARLCAERGLLPFIDLAYQGLGDGMEPDAAGVRIMARHCPEMLVAYTCDKNFGLYRERVGALFLLARSADDASMVQSNMLSLARANWSMPPDHGAAVTRIILESAALSALWRAELEEMRVRIVEMRERLAALDPALGFLTTQKGMFSTLDLAPEQIRQLREDHAVYTAGARINIAGLTPSNIAAFASALAAVR